MADKIIIEPRYQRCNGLTFLLFSYPVCGGKRFRNIGQENGNNGRNADGTTIDHSDTNGFKIVPIQLLSYDIISIKDRNHFL